MESKSQEDILWQGLGPDELRDIRQSANYIDLNPMDVLFRKGDSTRGIYLIVAGELDIHEVDAEGKPVYLTTLSSGNILGEIATMTKQSRTATVVAKTSAVVLKFDDHFIQELITRQPEIAIKLLRNTLTIMANTIVRLSQDVARLKGQK